MTPVLLHAAAFDPGLTRLALLEPLSSYQSMVTNRFYNTAFVYSIVPGALGAYDLPDLAASLAPRKLTIAGMTDAAGNSADGRINDEIAIVRAAYRSQRAEGQLKIEALAPNEKPHGILTEWLK